MIQPPSRTPVTGGVGRWPMLDRNHRQLHVGDRIRYQKCSGPYGQTERGEHVITEAHYHLCNVAGLLFSYDHEKQQLIGYYIHTDIEHGHEGWIEVVDINEDHHE